MERSEGSSCDGGAVPSPGIVGGAEGDRPRVAVIGGGYLGSKIAAELGLNGCDVMIYDRSAGEGVKAGVESSLRELERTGLLKMDDGTAAAAEGLTEGAMDALAKVSVGLSLAECVAGRNLIIEAVPDDAAIKGAVFREAIQHCAEDALLTTNTLSVTLKDICAYLPPAWHSRLLGLRFLAPVMFVPLCEITYRAGAQDGEMQRLSHMMETFDKVVFDCPQMAVAQGGGGSSSSSGGRPPLPPGVAQRESPYWLGYSRLRLNASESERHQTREARMWLLRRTGRDTMHRTTSQTAELELCVVCLTNQREALSISCGHKVMCLDCAARVKMINSSCPFCRVSMREVVLSKNRSTESVGSSCDAETTEMAGGGGDASATSATTDAGAIALPAATDERAGIPVPEVSGGAIPTVDDEASSGGSEGPGV